VKRFIELDTAAASDAPNQLSGRSCQGPKIEDYAIAAFELSVLDLDHAAIARKVIHESEAGLIAQLRVELNVDNESFGYSLVHNFPH
jgi:hypothetical protein